MADSKLADLTNLATVTADDLFYVVDDPAGTPADRKSTAATVATYIRTTAWSMIDEDTTILTSGSVTLNATAITDLTGTQVTLNGAATGDVVHFHLSAYLGAASSTKAFDVYTYVSSTRTNPFGPGLSATLASTGGIQGWWAANTGDYNLTGQARRVLVSGDISGGNVTVGLAYAANNTTARTLFATTNNPLQVIAQLWRPPT